MSDDELILPHPGTAMLQTAPSAIDWSKVLIGVVSAVLGWLLKSMLMSSFKQVVLDAVAAELDRRFKELEEHNDDRFNKINERIDTLAERRQWPRR